MSFSELFITSAATDPNDPSTAISFDYQFADVTPGVYSISESESDCATSSALVDPSTQVGGLMLLDRGGEFLNSPLDLGGGDTPGKSMIVVDDQNAYTAYSACT